MVRKELNSFSLNAPKISVFRDNPYIRYLNKLLQLELIAVELYHSLLQDQVESSVFELLASNHQKSARKLVCLIISNGGLPEENGFHLRTSIFWAIYSVSSRLKSDRLQYRMYSYCSKLEKALRRRYHRGLSMARRCDRINLVDLSHQIRKNIQILEHKLKIQ